MGAENKEPAMVRKFVFVTLSAITLCVMWLGVSGFIAAKNLKAAQLHLKSVANWQSLDDTNHLANELNLVRSDVHAAHKLVTGPIWWLSAQVPVLGNTPRAVRTLTESLDSILQRSTRLEDAIVLRDSSQELLSSPFLQNLTTGLADIQVPVAQASEKLFSLQLLGVPSSVQKPIETLRRTLTTATPYINSGAQLAQVAPVLFGLDKQQTWLIVFQNGAEARAAGGFPGGLGILNSKNGKLTLEKLESNDAIMAQPLTSLDGLVSPELVDLYGSDLTRLSDMSLSPDFPTNAKLFSAIYLQDTGQMTDGVIAMDEHALASIMKVTGPVTVGSRTLTSENIVDYVTKTVYQDYADPKKKDRALFSIVGQVFKNLNSVNAGQIKMLEALVPAVIDGRIRLWSSDPDTESVIKKSVLGASTDDLANPTHAVAFSNGGGNKIDAYVQAQVSYNGGQCVPYFPFRASIFRIVLKNDAPSSGLPGYVVPRLDLGQVVPKHPGSAKMLVYVHVPLGSEFQDAVIGDSQVSLVRSGIDNGRQVWRFDVELPASSTTDLVVSFKEPAMGTEYPPKLWQQAMAVPMTGSATKGPPCSLEGVN
ncbi:MAG: DUF4012 domain-containing protein [Actinomycetes bacterium]